MNPSRKQQINDWVEEMGINVHTISTPENWNGDSYFGLCDFCCEWANVVPICALSIGGEEMEFEVEEDIAYYLHGLAGAY
jgi:hypothetical protein